MNQEQWDELKRLYTRFMAGTIAIGDYDEPHEALCSALISAFPQILAEREAAQKEDGDSISDQLQGILGSGSICPLCARTNMHTHSQEEIIIYRNGLKYGKRLAADFQSALEFEQKGTDAVMKAFGMEATEGGNFNYLKACAKIRELQAGLRAAQRLRDALVEISTFPRYKMPSDIAKDALAAFDKETQNED